MLLGSQPEEYNCTLQWLVAYFMLIVVYKDADLCNVGLRAVFILLEVMPFCTVNYQHIIIEYV
jgi:hypothetical protein